MSMRTVEALDVAIALRCRCTSSTSVQRPSSNSSHLDVLVSILQHRRLRLSKIFIVSVFRSAAPFAGHA